METRKVGVGSVTMTGSYLRSGVEIEDQTLRHIWYVGFFALLCLGGHGMG